MEKKIKVLTTNILLIVIVLICSLSIFVSNSNIVANADVIDSEGNQEAEPLGLMTKLSIQLGSSDGNVWASVRNDFTLGKSVIEVYVELYSSYTYQDSYRNMMLENKNYIGDLDIYKTISTSAPINGVQSYWRGRLHYRMDKKDWVSKETTTYLVNVNGQVVG